MKLIACLLIFVMRNALGGATLWFSLPEVSFEGVLSGVGVSKMDCPIENVA